MEERDDYPIIPQGEEAPKKEEVKDVYVLIDELHADADYLLSRAIQKPEDKAMLVEAVRRKLDLIKELAVPETTVIDGIKIIKLMCELASLKEVVKELIPIAEERLRRIVNYDMPDYHKVTGSIKSIIDRAKRISDNK